MQKDLSGSTQMFLGLPGLRSEYGKMRQQMNRILQRYIFIGLILCLLFSGCLKREPEPDPYPKITRIWADPSESSITLQWKYDYSSTPNEPSTIPLVEPKHIEIYFGESPTELSLYKTLEKTDSLLQFTGLVTGKPYYFSVRLIVNNAFRSSASGVMAIPSKFNPLKRIHLPKDISTFNKNYLIYIAYFPDTTKLLVSYWDAGTYFHNLKTNRWVKLTERTGYPAWDRSNKKVAIGRNYGDFKSTPAFIDIFDYSKWQDSIALMKSIQLPSSWLAGYIWSRDEKSILLNIPIPSPSPIHQLFISNDSLVVLGAPTRYNKHSFVWLDDNRLLLGGFTSLNGGVYNYRSDVVAATSSSTEPITYNLPKGIYESLPEHSQLHEIGFLTPVNQASSKIAYIDKVSGYASVWLYDMVTRKARPLTKRLSNSPIVVHGLQWNEYYKTLNLYYSDYSADTVVNAYTIPF